MQVERRQTTAIGLALALAILVVPVGAYECEDYYPSSEQYDPWWGNYCAGSGGGCTECYNVENGESCTTDHGETCEPQPWEEHQRR